MESVEAIESIESLDLIQSIESIELLESIANREDGSDVDDFLTKSIALTRSSFSKIFASLKKNCDHAETNDTRKDGERTNFTSDAEGAK